MLREAHRIIKAEKETPEKLKEEGTESGVDLSVILDDQDQLNLNIESLNNEKSVALNKPFLASKEKVVIPSLVKELCHYTKDQNR